jgi:hypothetical protein
MSFLFGIRRKIENSDSGNSSEYDPSDEEQHVEDVSVPSTERMLKVNIFLIMSTMCVNQTFIHTGMYMYVHFLYMLNYIWHNLKIPNRKLIKQHALCITVIYQALAQIVL